MKGLIFREKGQLPEFSEKLEGYEVGGWEKVSLSHSAINHRDIWITKGLYAGIVTDIILGSDGVGTFSGKKVIINPSIHWGDKQDVQGPEFRVFGMPDQGTFAEECFVPRVNIHKMPPHLSAEEAAALPLAGLTAFRALNKKTNPKPKEKVLITGIGGGVALQAAQFAKALGCEVYGTSGHYHKLMKAVDLGIIKAGVNYKSGNWAEQLKEMTGGVDIIVDSACGPEFNKLVKLANFGGRIVFYGGSLGNITELNPQIIFWKQLSILGSTMGSDGDFQDMLEFTTKHQIRPVVDSVFALHEVEKAFTRVKNGEQFGKVVFDHSL